MADPARNAAIWYATDGFDPEAKGVNGRRVAGASFLKGFFRHADVDEFVAFTAGDTSREEFIAKARQAGVTVPLRGAYFHTPRQLEPAETIYFAAPNFAEECWRRFTHGSGRYSICGITHTTATKAVMLGVHDLRAAPQMEWDGIICTSRAVHASHVAQMDMVDEHLKTRFGQVPPRPQMPVIPLGINCDEFTHDPAARKSLRDRMGWGEKDVVVSTLARLVPYGKFDPFPLFMALRRAQDILGDTCRLHLVACGIYSEDHSRNVFDSGAQSILGDITYLHLDGADAQNRRETFSGSDIFTFPIDNIQETFGLAPIEAMAAGLPVVVSDWDGMKDTVTSEVGIRVPTRTLSPAHGVHDAWRHQLGMHTYAQYGNNAAAMTEIDLDRLTRAFVDLARNPDMRKRMGENGLRRAQSVYDWANIIPQYQDFWSELSAIRRAANPEIPDQMVKNPIAPPPTDLFAAYPTEQFGPGVATCYALDGTGTVEQMYALRRYPQLKQPFEKAENVQRVLDVIRAAGSPGIDARAVATKMRINPLSVERMFVWLLKFGFIARVADRI